MPSNDSPLFWNEFQWEEEIRRDERRICGYFHELPSCLDLPGEEEMIYEKLFSQVDICEENLHIPSGAAEDAAAECAAYDELIRALGGIDLQLLGIGRNGHVGFNEPDEYLIAGTHLTPLTEDTISANSRFFASEEEVPKHALTMGMASILQARKILLLATGESKREAVRALRDDRVTTACPASLLKLHPNVIVLCDKAAYGE